MSFPTGKTQAGFAAAVEAFNTLKEVFWCEINLKVLNPAEWRKRVEIKDPFAIEVMAKLK